jgi:hypothetical protein
MSGGRELRKLTKDLARSREEIAALQKKLREFILKKKKSPAPRGGGTKR